MDGNVGGACSDHYVLMLPRNPRFVITAGRLIYYGAGEGIILLIQWM